MKKIVVTGGAGFIGSHIVEMLLERYPQAQVTILDKMTYATNIRSILHLASNPRVQLIVGDICEMYTSQKAVKDADLVIHAAAESHVDNSFGNSLEFTRSNTLGTHTLIEACRALKVPRIIHVSTDEVYGEIMSGSVDEEAPLKPTNPYSASKAAAEMVVQGYLQSFDLPAVILRANNIFGIRQYPEKIIPRFITLLMKGEKLTLHGSGKNTRHYLSAHDLMRALLILIEKGKTGECYNIGTIEEYQNIEMAQMICALFGLSPQEHITFVEDRPFNDARYAVDWSKISTLGWKPQSSINAELPAIAQWYADHFDLYNTGQPVRRPLARAA
ncbi:MAG: dTDP-glucose 4,6-dehydratase [Micavibrio aeruginosavorus]|uniref:dTDP-glucose 4,6-dehydratase n=1 Tax=Micavibrio aeruginosavorus TaxID=349221 RepID=A0A7T5R160_9BACT|nr:MAG: dTDP-glucose 4,6-dehydratase [Micavibrio aeruginosavorus]